MSHSSLETTETPPFHRKHPSPNNLFPTTMAIRGGFLRLVMITAYAIAFCCAAIITGAFAWVSPTKEEKKEKEKKKNEHTTPQNTSQSLQPSASKLLSQRLTPLTLVPRRTRQLLQHRLSSPRRSNPHLLHNLHPRNLLHSRDVPRLHRSSSRLSPHRTHDGRSNHQSLRDRLGQLRRFR